MVYLPLSVRRFRIVEWISFLFFHFCLLLLLGFVSFFLGNLIFVNRIRRGRRRRHRAAVSLSGGRRSTLRADSEGDRVVRR